MLIVLCAEEEEAKHINHPKAKVIVTGVGVVNIIKSLTEKIPPKAKIINIGYAGSNKYPVGSVISVNKVERLYKPKIINESSIKLVPCYVDDICYTCDDFINASIDAELPLVDMELYYLAARYPNIESIKIVSDNLNLNEHRTTDLSASWETVNRILNNL